MSTDDIYSQLGMMQLADSFFPSGLYTTSNGLEVLIHYRKVKNVDDLQKLLLVFLQHQIGPADCVALANIFDAIEEKNTEKLIEIDQTTFCMKLVKEIRETSTRSGIQLIRCVSSFNDEETLISYQDLINQNRCTGVYPVAFAIASNALGIKKEQAASMLLYGFVVSVVGAALRMGLVDHFESQRVIHQIKPIISQIIAENINRDISQMWQFAPELEIFQIAHERQSTKMFIT